MPHARKPNLLGILNEMRHTGEMPHGAAHSGTAQRAF
jgi:hypothetical protein